MIHHAADGGKPGLIIEFPARDGGEDSEPEGLLARPTGGMAFEKNWLMEYPRYLCQYLLGLVKK